MILINAQSISKSQLSGQEENISHGYYKRIYEREANIEV